MPGINILITKFGNAEEFHQETGQIIYQTSQLSISKSLPYPHYPVYGWEKEHFIFVVEGFFFEWIDYKAKLEQFADSFGTAINKDALLAEYFAETDGEFIVVVHDKRANSTIILNDVLGRLPLYISETKQSTVVSRNISFIEKVQGLSPNSDAFLETLTFGYTIGTKTLYKDINRVPGGTIIEISEHAFSKRQYHIFNFECLIEENLDTRQVISNVRSLFIEALKNRSKFSDLNILSLSGGLDSRAVAGAFLMSGLPYSLFTFADKEGHAQKDIECARKIAANQHVSLALLHLSEPGIRDFELMFNHKYGLAGLDMTFLIDYYRSLVSLSVTPALFTGDGGDKVFPDLRPGTFIHSTGSIVDYAVRFNTIMDPAVAATILGKTQSSLHTDVAHLMSSYPESGWEQKYIHFVMENRVGNWLLEGEDRNRCFLTSFTPFYHLRIFKSLMSVPPRFKRNFGLYRTFLKSIAPETYDIPNANWGFEISKKESIRWIYFKQNLKNTWAGAKLKKWKKQSDNYLIHLTAAEKELFTNLSSVPAVQRTFDIQSIRKLKSLSADNFLNLLTLMKIASV